MSSAEIATRVDNQVASIIQTAAQDLSDAHKIGTALASTSFVPAHFKGKPDEAAAAILYGSTIDMDPLTALQNIFVIGGKPALYARSMVAVVLSKGHRIWTEDESDGTVTVAGQRKGSETVERVTWTTDMAKKAGYTKNANYGTNSRAMLYARASGDVARRVAPDALLGMAYTKEELEMEAAPTTAAPQAKPGDRLRAAVNLPPAPVEDIADAEVVDVSESVEMISDAQMKALHASFNDAEITDRAERLDVCMGVIGRDIDSSKDLTRSEASAVLDRIKALPAEDGA